MVASAPALAGRVAPKPTLASSVAARIEPRAGTSALTREGSDILI